MQQNLMRLLQMLLLPLLQPQLLLDSMFPLKTHNIEKMLRIIIWTIGILET